MTRTNPDEAGASPREEPTGGRSEGQIDVHRAAADCYTQLLQVEQFPRFLGGVERVRRLGNARAAWFVRGGERVEQGTVEFYGLVDDQKFAWRPVDGPAPTGAVHLEPLTPSQTRVTLTRSGPSAAARARTDVEPDVYDDLVRFKRLMEARPETLRLLASRVDLPCTLLGLSAPPCAVRARVALREDGMTMTTISRPGSAPRVARWLEALGPVSIRVAGGLAPKVLTATFDTVPPTFAPGLALEDVTLLALMPDGTASVFLDGSALAADRFAAKHQLIDPHVRVRRAETLSSPPRLRARQHRLVSLAVALGYYEVPHRLTLRELAKRVGLSAGTVAATLRAAEGTLISAHVDALMHDMKDLDGQDPASQETPGPETGMVTGTATGPAGRRGPRHSEAAADVG